MWMYLALSSALLLGCYDVTKKISLRRNSVLWVLFATTLFSTILLTPTLKGGPAGDFLLLVPKAILVGTSWIAGLMGMKYLPLTTAGVIKASRPVFVLIFSILIFGEHLNWGQWAGVVVAITSLYMLSRSSRREGIYFSRNKGIWWMGLAVIAGVSSALYDKFVIGRMDPVFVLGWSYVFTAGFMGIILALKCIFSDESVRNFKFDWWLVATSVLIVAADALYFFALAQDGSMLSIVSLTRRASVIVTFVLSAIVLKEGNIRAKAIDLAVLLCGIVILFFSSH